MHGRFIFTASHNPVPNEDMGIKFNRDNGAAIPEGKNNEVFESTKKTKDKPREIKVDENGIIRTVNIEIESTIKSYFEEM